MNLQSSNFNLQSNGAIAQLPIRSRAFSFTELLFAVMILGIGFIMLAAIFPVGLSQTKSNYEESLGAGIGRGASHQLGQIASEATLPATPPLMLASGNSLAAGESASLGVVMSFRDARLSAATRNTLWNQVCRNLVTSSDPRFAWVPLYMRKTTYTNNDAAAVPLDNGTGRINPAFGLAATPLLTAKTDSLAQVIMIGMRINNRSEYDTADFYRALSPLPAPPAFYQIEPKPVAVQIARDPATGNFIMVFQSVNNLGTTPPPPAPFVNPANPFPTSPVMDSVLNAIAPGSFVVIADDRITSPVAAIGRMNGRIYRVGNNIVDNSWELMPGYEFSSDPGPDGRFLGPGPDGVAGNADDNDDINSLGITGVGGVDAVDNSDSSNTVSAGPAIAYVVGKGFSKQAFTPPTVDTSDGIESTYEGGIQDICVYTSFVAVKK